MKSKLNKAAAALLMAAVMITMNFAMAGEDVHAAGKVPAKPKITKAAVVNNNAVQLKWSKARNTTKYRIYRKKANGKFVLVKTVKATAKRSFQNKKLAYGTKYTYKVTAISKTGKKNTSKVKVVYTKPAKPVITAKVYDNNNVKVTWKAAKGAVKYKVYRKKADGKYVLVKTTTKKTYESKDLAYSTKYTYKVKAVSKAGKMNTSLTRIVVTGAKAPVPETPETPDTPGEPDTPVVPSQPVTPDCAVVGHNFKGVKTIAATCSENGYIQYKCSRCDAGKQEITSAMLGHSWYVKNTQDSTYTEEGCTNYACFRCQETKQKVIPKKEKPAEPETPDTPEEPAVPFEPVVPSQPATPEDSEKPEQPAEKTVTVQVPEYVKEYLFYIKDKNGNVILRTSSEEEFTKLEAKEKLIVDGVTYKWSDIVGDYGQGTIRYIAGYTTYTMTESEWNESLFNGRDGVVLSETVPEVPKLPVITPYEEPENEDGDTPAEPETPDQETPEQPAERMVTVKVPIYETKTIYWIKSYEGEVIYKSTDWEEWGGILDRPAIIIDGVEYDPRVTYGTNGRGPEYQIIMGYNELIMTESEWNESYYNELPDVIWEYNEQSGIQCFITTENITSKAEHYALLFE